MLHVRVIVNIKVENFIQLQKLLQGVCTKMFSGRACPPLGTSIAVRNGRQGDPLNGEVFVDHPDGAEG
jgi:hypothetical protein